MAIPFLSALAKTLQRWRRRPLETKPRLDHRNLALESLEERVNPANFNIDLAGYSGTLQVTSINTGSSDLTITQAGTDILAFSSATSIYVNGKDTGSGTYSLNLTGKSTLQKINVTTSAGIQESVQFSNLSASNFTGTNALELAITPNAPSNDNDSLWLTNVTTVVPGITSGGAITLDGNFINISGSTITGSGGLSLISQGASNSATTLASKPLLQTYGGPIHLTGTVHLGDSTTLASYSSSYSSAGSGAITLDGPVDENSKYTLTLFSGQSATRVKGALTVENLSLQDNSSASSGDVSLEGNLTVNSLTTFAQNYKVSVTGASNQSATAVNFLNTGGLTLGDSSSDKFASTSSFTATGSAVTLSGTLLAAGVITLGDLALLANSTVDASGGAGYAVALPIGVALNGFSLATKTGVNLATTVNGTVDLSATFTATSDLIFSNATMTLNGTTILASAGVVTLSGTTTIAGNGSDLTLTGADLNLSGLASNAIADVATLTVTATANRTLGVGTGAGGQFQLDQAELNRLNASLLVIGDGTSGILVGDAVSSSDTVSLITSTRLAGKGSTTVIGSSINVTGDFIIADAVEVSGGSYTVSATGTIDITGGSAGIYATAGQFGNSLILQAAGAVSAGSSAGFGKGGTAAYLDNLTLSGSSVTVGATSQISGNLSLTTSSSAGTASLLSFTAGNNLTISNASPLTITGTLTATLGSLTQSGGGDVSLGGDLHAGTKVQFTNGVTLTATTTVEAPVIQFTGTVDGNSALTLQGTTTNNLSGLVGSITPLASLTFSGKPGIINAASDIVTDGNVVSIGGTGPATFQKITTAVTGAVSLATASTITIGETTTAGGTVTLAAGGALSTGVLSAGAVSLSSSSGTAFVVAINSTGAVLVTGAGGVTLNGSIAAGGDVTLGALGQVVTAAANLQVDSSGTAARITSPGTLLLNSGVSMVLGNGGTEIISLATLTGAPSGAASNLTVNTNGSLVVSGTLSQIGALILTTGTTATLQAVSATSVTLDGGSGSQALEGMLTAGSVTTSTNSFNLALIGNLKVTGATSLSNTGPVTLGNNASDSMAFEGGLTRSGGDTTLAGSISSLLTSGISLESLTVSASSLISTASGSIALGGASGTTAIAAKSTLTVSSTLGKFSVGGTMDGPGSLVVSTGGAVSLTSTVGTSSSLSRIDIQQAAGATFDATVTAGTLSLGSAVTGAVTFADTLQLTSRLDTGAGSYKLSLLGNASVAGTTVIASTGVLILGQGGSTTATFADGLTATAPSSVLVAGNITLTTSGASLTLGDSNTPLTITDNTNLTTNAGTVTLGAITLMSGVSLGVSSGTGPINLGRVANDSKAVSATSLQLTGGKVTGSGAINIDSFSIASSSALFSDVIGNAVAPILTVLATTSGTVAFTGATTTLASGSAFNAGGYSLQFDSTQTTFLGDATFTNTGSLRLGDSAADQLDYQGSLSGKTNAGIAISGIQRFYLAGSVGELGNASAGTITLGADTQILPQAGATGMTIILAGPLALAGYHLTVGSGLDTTIGLDTLTGGTGDLTLDTTSAITASGAVTGLDALTIIQSNGALFSGAVTAVDFTVLDSGSTGTIAVLGALTLSGNLLATGTANAYGMSLLGNTAISGTTILANTGAVELGNNASSVLLFAGGLTANTPSKISLAGSISTSNSAISLADATLTDNTALSSGKGAIILGGISGSAQELTLGNAGQTGAISATGIVNALGLKTASGAYALSLLGNTVVSQAVTLTNTGLVTLGDKGETFGFDGGLTRTAGSTTLFGFITAGSQKITLGSVALTGDSGIDAGSELIRVDDVLGLPGVTFALGAGNSGPITLGSFARNGSTGSLVNLTINTTGTLTVTGDIGQGVGTVTISNADTVNFQGAVGFNGATASPINSLVLTNAATGVNFPGSLATVSLSTGGGAFAVAFTGASTSVTNAVILQNTGVVTLGDTASDSLLFAGGLTATATTGVNLGGALQTTGSGLQLAATTLIQNSSITTGAGAISLASISGSGTENLTIATTSTLAVAGTTSNLGSLTLGNTGGAIFTGLVDVATLSITDTTGTVALVGGAKLGVLNTAAKGYSLNISGATVTNFVNLQNTGAVTLSGTLAFDGGISATAASSITLSGATLGAIGVGTINLATTNPVSAQGASQIGGSSTGAITLPAIILANGASLLLGAGAGTPITTDSISGTAGGTASSLAFDTLGTVTVNGLVGTDLSTLSLTSVGSATFSSTLQAGIVTIASATGTVTFTGNVSTIGNFDAQSANYALRLQGASNSIGAKLLLANQGTAFLGTTTSSKTLATGGIFADPGNTVTATGSLAAAGTKITLDALNLAGNTLIDTTNGGAFPAGAAINLSTTNTNGYLLSLNSGTAGKTVITDITLAGVFTSASPLEFAGKVTLAANTTISAPSISFTSSSSVDGNSLDLGLSTNGFAFAAGATLGNLDLISISSQTAGVTIGLGDKSGASILLSDAFLAAADSASGVMLLTLGSGPGTGVIRAATADGQVEINTSTRISGSGSTTILSSDIVVVGDFRLDDAVEVNGGNRAIEASGSLTITGGTAGIYATTGQTNNLVLRAGTDLAAGSGTGFGSGSGRLVQNVTLEGGTLTLGSASSTIAGSLLASSSKGFLNFSGQVVAGGSVSIATDGPISLQAISTGAVAGLGFSQTGTGLVTLHDSLDTAGGSISFDSNITLTTLVAGALVSIATTSASSGGAAISLQGIAGTGNDLHLDSGKGSITVAAAVTGIDEMQLQSAAATSTGGVAFQSTLSANSLVTHAQPYSLSLLGDTTILQAATLANSGLTTLGDDPADDLTFTAGLIHTAGSTSLGGNIATTNAAITLGTTSVMQSVEINSGNATTTLGALTLADGITLTVATGGASFTTIDSATGGTGSLTIKASGPVMASGAIGATTPLGILQLQSANGTTLQSTLDATAFSIGNSVTGTVWVDGALTLDSLTITAAGYNLDLSGGGSVNNDVAFLNTGTLALNATAGNTLALGGSMTALTQSSRTMAGTITSVGTMNLGTVALASATALVGSGGLTVAAVTSAGNALRVESGSGATLSVTSMTNLAGGLTLTNSGAAATIGDLGTLTAGPVTVTDSQGLVTFAGGVNATTITITDSQSGLNFSGPVTASGAVTLTDTADGKTVVFSSTLSAGSLSASTLLNTDAFNIRLTANTTVTGSSSLYNTGAVDLGGATGATLDLQGGLIHQAGLTNLGGTITTAGGSVSLADLTLTASSLVRTHLGASAGGNLSLSGAVNGASYDLTIDLGTSAGVFTAKDSVDRIGTFTITSANQATFQGPFGQTAPGIALVLNAIGTGGMVSFLADTNLVSITNNAGNSSWSFTGDSTTVTRTLSLVTTGSVRLGDGGSLLTFTDGATLLAGAGISLDGQVQTTGGKPLTLGDATSGVSVAGVSTVGGLTTGAISLGDSTLGNKVVLTILGTAAAALRAVQGAPGATDTGLVIQTGGAANISGIADNVSSIALERAAGATFSDSVGVSLPGSLTVGSSITGVVLFSGKQADFLSADFQAGTYAAQLKNTQSTVIQSNTEFNNTGGVWLGTAASMVTLNGTLDVTSSPTTLAGLVGTSGKAITFFDTVTLASDSTLSTILSGAAGGAIHFQSSLDAATASTQSLSLASGTGKILVDGTVDLGTLSLGANAGATFAKVVTVRNISSSTASTGTLRFDSLLTAPDGVSLAGNVIELNEVAASEINAAPGNIDLTAGVITLRGDLVSRADVASAPLGYNQQGGSITLTGAVQLDTASVLIDNQPATGGIFRYTNNPVLVTGTVDGLSSGSASLVINSPGGAVTITGAVGSKGALDSLQILAGNTGDISIQAATLASLSLVGHAVALHGPVRANGDINLTGADVSLADSAKITNTAGGMVITGLSQTSIGTGAISLSGAFSQQGAGLVSSGANISAESIQFISPITLTASVLLNTQLAGGDIRLNTVDNAAGLAHALAISSGPGSITAGDIGALRALAALTLNSDGDVSLTNINTVGAIAVTGGLVRLGGSTVTSSAAGIQITGPVELSGSGAIALQALGGDIHLAGAVDDPGSNSLLTAAAGGNLLIDGDIGASVPLASANLQAMGIILNGNLATRGDATVLSTTGSGLISLGATEYMAGAQLVIGNQGQSLLLTASGGASVSLAAGTGLSIPATMATNTSRDLSLTTATGDLLLGSLVAAGGIYFHQVEVNSHGGTTTLAGSSILLDGSGSSPGSFTVLGGGAIALASSVTIDTGASFVDAGAIDLTNSPVHALAQGYDLILDATAPLGQAGSINFGSISNQGATAYLARSFQALSTGKTHGVITVNGSQIAVAGGVTTGVKLDSLVVLTRDLAISSPGAGVALATDSGSVSSSGGIWALSIDTSPVSGAGGSVRLGLFDDFGGGFVGATTLHTSAGDITSGPGVVVLDRNISLEGSFAVTNPAPVLINGEITIDTNQSAPTGGSVYLGGSGLDAASVVSTAIASSTLHIITTGPDGSGQVALGGVNATGGFYLSGLTIDSGIDSAKVGSIRLNGSISVAGRVLLDGAVEVPASLVIDSTKGTGSISIGATAGSLSATQAGLLIDLQSGTATGSGGSVVLGKVNNAAGAYLQSLTVTTTGVVASGALTLRGNISLDGSSQPASFIYEAGNSLGASVLIDGQVTIDTATSFVTGGAVYLGHGDRTASAPISSITAGSTLAIVTDATVSGGDIAIGTVSNSGGLYLEQLLLNAGKLALTDGRVWANTAKLAINADAAGSLNLIGDIVPTRDLEISTWQGAATAGSIVVNGSISPSVQGLNLSLNSGITAAGQGGGTVSLLANSSGASKLQSITITSAGLVGAGVLTLGGDFALYGVTQGASFILDNDGSLCSVVLADNLRLSLEQASGMTGSSVLLGDSSSFSSSATITAANRGLILQVTTGSGASVDQIAFGSIDNSGGEFLAGVHLATSASGVIRINGGSVALRGPMSATTGMLVAGGGDLAITTSGTGGSVLLDAVLSSMHPNSSLQIDTSTTTASTTGGVVQIGTVDGLKNITITTSGPLPRTDGDLTLNGNITLSGGTFNLTNPADVTINGSLVIRTTSTDGKTAGNVYLGNDGSDLLQATSAIMAGSGLSSLSINTSALNGKAGGIALGAVRANSAGALLDGLGLLAFGVADASDGTILLNGDLRVAGGVNLQGIVVLPGATSIDTSGTVGGNVYLATETGFLQPFTGLSGVDLTVTTGGSVSSGGIHLGSIASDSSGSFLNDILLNTGSGAGAGSLTLVGSISLASGSGDAASFVFSTPGGSVYVDSLAGVTQALIKINTASGTGAELGGDILLGGSTLESATGIVYSVHGGDQLSLSTAATKTSGNIGWGGVLAMAGKSMTVFQANASITDPVTSTISDNPGMVRLNGSQVITSGTGSLVELVLAGDVVLTQNTILQTNGNTSLPVAGDVQFAGTLRGSTPGIDLTINTSAIATGGSVGLSTINGLHDVNINTQAAASGNLALYGNIRLESDHGQLADLTVAGSPGVVVDQAGITAMSISTDGGDVRLGQGTLSARAPGQSLNITTNLPTGEAGTILLGSVNAVGGAPLSGLSLDTGTHSITTGFIGLGGPVSLDGPFIAQGNIGLPGNMTINTTGAKVGGLVNLAGTVGGVFGMQSGSALTVTTGGGAIILGDLFNHTGAYLNRVVLDTTGASQNGPLTLNGQITIESLAATGTGGLFAFKSGNAPVIVGAVDVSIHTASLATGQPASILLGTDGLDAASPVRGGVAGATFHLGDNPGATQIATGPIGNGTGATGEFHLARFEVLSGTGNYRINGDSIATDGAAANAGVSLTGQVTHGNANALLTIDTDQTGNQPAGDILMLGSFSGLNGAKTSLLLDSRSAGSLDSGDINALSDINLLGDFSAKSSSLATSGNLVLGKMSVGGATSLDAGAGQVSATNSGNDFIGPVSVQTQGQVRLVDSNALTLGTIILGTELADLRAIGSITQATGSVFTQSEGAQSLDITSTSGLIALGNPGNLLTAPIVLETPGGGSITVVNATPLVLAGVAMAPVGLGELSLTALGGITQETGSSVVTGKGTVRLDAGAGPIDLGNATNQFIGVLSATNTAVNDIVISTTGRMLLGSISMTATTAGRINLLGTLGIEQQAGGTIATGSGAVLLRAPAGGLQVAVAGANAFNGPVSLQVDGDFASLTAKGGLTLAESTVGGAVPTALTIVVEGGSLSDSGPLNLLGTASFSTLKTGALISLDQLNAQAAVTANTQGAGGNATLVNSLPLAFQGVVGDRFSVTATTGRLTDSGLISFGSSLTLRAPGDSVLDGNLVSTDAKGGLTFQGAGSLLLAGESTYSGTTTINDGILVVTGSIQKSLVAVNSGILGGTGTVGAISSLATVRPGSSPGILTSKGTVTLVESSHLAMEINGGIPDTSYDQVVTQGSVLLNNPALDLVVSSGFDSHAVAQLKLIDNRSTTPVQGQFINQPEGSLVPLNGVDFVLSYHGGDGNDVTLSQYSPTPILVSGGGTGSNGQTSTSVVTVINPLTSQSIILQPFGPSFYSTCTVANGLDPLTADRYMAVGAGVGGNSHVKLLNITKNVEMLSFYAFPGFQGEVYVALADVNHDNTLDLVVSAGAGASPAVAVFDGHTGVALFSFYAYDPSFTGGVRVAAADVNNDGFVDIVTGSGLGARGTLNVFNGATNFSLQSSTFAFESSFTGGLYVGSGDLSGDGRAEVIVSQGQGGTPNVLVYQGGSNLTRIAGNFLAYDAAFRGGVRVGTSQEANSSRTNIVTGTGPGPLSDVRIFSGTNFELLDSLYNVLPDLDNGVYVG